MKFGKVKIIFYTLLFAVLIAAVYFHNNASTVYSHLGDLYIKNEPQKGLGLYEKSILLGNKDSKFREKYVNALINQPFSIDSQEKLVKIAEDDINDAASANAEYYLYNLKREIHNKYPLNYIKQAPFNQKIMHWGEMPITYTFKTANNIPKEIVASANSAFDEWERASSCRIKFKKVNNSSNANIIVDFIAEKPDQIKDGEKYVVGYTTPILSQEKLKNMVIKLNIYDIEGNIYSQNQIYNTALHEVFHALGFMGHSYDKQNIMFMAKDEDTVLKDSKKELNEADKTTLELLYKIKPDITNSEQLKYEYIPYLILGDSEDINYSKINEAKNYIRKAPQLAMGYIDLAEGLVAQKRFPEAIGNLEKALRLARNDEIRSIIYYNLAISHYYITNYDLALDYVQKAQEIKDGDDLHILSAEIFIKQKKQKEALKEYEELLKNDPDNINYAVNIANIYLNEHNYIKARNVLKTFIKKNPSQKNSPKLQSYGILVL